jgi:hypothetical protein
MSEDSYRKFWDGTYICSLMEKGWTVNIHAMIKTY